MSKREKLHVVIVVWFFAMSLIVNKRFFFAQISCMMAALYGVLCLFLLRGWKETVLLYCTVHCRPLAAAYNRE